MTENNLIKRGIENSIISSDEYNLMRKPQNTLTNLEKILKSKIILSKNRKKKIEFSKPLLKISDESLIFPHSIVLIQGKSGTHKSRLAEHISSAFLRKSGYMRGILELEARENINVVYVDTERNLTEQFPYSIQQILINSGHEIDEEVNNFDYLSLIDIERGKRFEAFKEYLDTIREKYTDHVLIILDVLTDLIDNFNDPKPSLQLIDLLNSVINNYDVSFLCIVHENPNAEKARGHLGTELLNKSSSALSINFEKDKTGADQDVIKINFLKCRTSKRIEPKYVKYDPEEKILVYCNGEEIEKAIYSKDMKANIFDVAKFLVANLKNSIPKQELMRMLREEFKCTSRTIEDRLRDLTIGTGIYSLGYQLIKSKNGKEVYYNLEPYHENSPQEEIF